MEPDQIILDFLQKLPDTIKEGVLARCCVAFDLNTDLGSDYFQEIASFLSPQDEAVKVEQCAKLVGVIELALIYPDNEEAMQRMFEKTGNQIWNSAVLRAPLAKRHYEQSFEEFRRIREGPIHPASLHQWQQFLLAKNPIGS